MAAVAVQSASSSRTHPPITILKRTREDLPLSQTKFLKKTARGKVLTCTLISLAEVSAGCRILADVIVLRERYVRDDIPCGFESCRHCDAFPGHRPVLPDVGYRAHMKYTGKEGHYLVIDTNIVLHQASLLFWRCLD